MNDNDDNVNVMQKESNIRTESVNHLFIVIKANFKVRYIEFRNFFSNFKPKHTKYLIETTLTTSIGIIYN